MDDNSLWRAVLGELEVTLTHASFSTWIKNTSIIGREDGSITIGVPNIFSKRWLEDKFSAEIRDALGRIDPSVRAVTYKVATDESGSSDSKPVGRSGKPQAVAKPGKKTAAPAPAAQTSIPMQASSGSQKNLNPRYVFSSFVVGPSNEMANAACQAVAAYPGVKYNPLYLYGGPGLGKTHLMQAVGNEILRRDPSCRIEYITIEGFTNEFVHAIQKKKNSAFVDKYRNVDVLIIDDMQFLVGKERTQEEFFHTFNALHQANKQIIISSDKPPQMLVQLEERLRSRLAMGLIADVQPPDLETRQAILQAKAAQQGRMIPLEVVDYLARNSKQNIRELEGVLTRLFAACDLKGVEPTLHVAASVVSGQPEVKPRHRPLVAKHVIERVAAYYDLQIIDLTGGKRDKEIVVPRQIAMYIMRHDMNLSFPKIGDAIGGRDHTTAMHSVKKITKLIESDEALREELQSIRSQLSIS